MLFLLIIFMFAGKYCTTFPSKFQAFREKFYSLLQSFYRFSCRFALVGMKTRERRRIRTPLSALMKIANRKFFKLLTNPSCHVILDLSLQKRRGYDENASVYFI